MKRWATASLLVVLVVPLIASSPTKPTWRMRADYVEACSCHLFCPCYFNKHAEHPHCEFNMAVNVRDGHSGKTNLTGAKYWLTGELGGCLLRPFNHKGATRCSRTDDSQDLRSRMGRIEGAGSSYSN